jgi:hypothetical protein
MLERGRYWTSLIWRGWWRLVVLAYAVLGLYDLTLSQVVSPLVEKPDDLPKLTTALRTSDIPWFLWAIGLLVLVLIIALEGAYREHIKADTKAATLTDRLATIEALRAARPWPKLVYSVFPASQAAESGETDYYALQLQLANRPDLPTEEAVAKRVRITATVSRTEGGGSSITTYRDIPVLDVNGASISTDLLKRKPGGDLLTVFDAGSSTVWGNVTVMLSFNGVGVNEEGWTFNVDEGPDGEFVLPNGQFRLQPDL